MNHWLSFPLSPSHTPFQNDLHPHEPHHSTLGLVTDNNTHNPSQTQEWNLVDSHNGDQAPKVADFLGVGKPDNTLEFSAFNQMPAAAYADYQLLTNCTPQLENSVAAGTTEEHKTLGNVGNLQSLTLSVGNGKGPSGEPSGGNANEAAPRRSVDTFGQRTSIYRGVTRHRWTGRYEAHLWDNSCRREGQSRKGRQVYLGGYDKEEKAARSYDLAALKYWGTSTTTNFPINNYEKELEEMKHMTRQEYVASLRRKSSGFSRGASMYRGVTRHHQHGRWQARIGRVAGNKDLYLGTFSTEEEAAEAYDIAAIKFRGLNAVTNFDMNRYDVKSIMESNTLPIRGGAATTKAMESRKREELQAVTCSNFLEDSFQFHGAHPYMSFGQQSQSFDPEFLRNYHHHHSTSLQLLSNNESDSNQFHQAYVNSQQTPAFLHNLMTMAPSSVEGNGSSSVSSYNGGYIGNGFGMPGSSSTSVNFERGIGLKPDNMGPDCAPGDLGLVKADYEMGLGGGYSDWTTDQVRGANQGVFAMWNDN